MSGASSSGAGWFSLLEPAQAHGRRPVGSDDPRLDVVIEPWQGDLTALRPGRAVLFGFPQDEGVRRNHGRPGAAQAPHSIRRWLGRLTPGDPPAATDLHANPPLDAGNVRIVGGLEESQQALGTVVSAIFQAGAIPVVLGGGHETAYGHFLGYVNARRPVGIINIDAHLDVRPCLDGQGHSGSPFRQALEHATQPLEGAHYVCLGAQSANVSRQHWEELRARGGVVRWADEVRNQMATHLTREIDRLAAAGCRVYVSIDADVVRAADVPGVSAPNPLGLSGDEVAACARLAGQSPAVASFDLVEINPRHDRDDQSSRWAALAVRNFLLGLAER